MLALLVTSAAHTSRWSRLRIPSAEQDPVELALEDLVGDVELARKRRKERRVLDQRRHERRLW
jgi:hypothetical protein